MQQKIIIFTNISGLEVVDKKKSSLKAIPLIDENNFIVYDYSKREFVVGKSIEDGNIFLADDNIIGKKIIDDFLGQCDKNNVFVLKHTFPEIGVLDGFFNLNSGGRHQGKKNGGAYYHEVLDILTDEDDDKFDRLIKVLFSKDPVLESKLSLLHCLYKTPPDIAFADEIKLIEDDKKKYAAYKSCHLKDSGELKKLRVSLFNEQH